MSGKHNPTMTGKLRPAIDIFDDKNIFSQDVCTLHILRDVEDAIPYIFDDKNFSSQDVCTSHVRRDVEDAIPYGLFFTMAISIFTRQTNKTPFF